MDNASAISILDRALKGRNRRDRDGKRRRPVTDGLIEYAKDLRDENDALRDENDALSAKIFELEHVVVIRDFEIEALDAKIIELKSEIAATTPSNDGESAAAE